MKLFACQSCQQMVFFESVTCTNCGHALGYAPDRGVICALEPEPPVWRAVSREDGHGGDGPRYRLCRNQIEHGVCNWLVPDTETDDYCQACRLNHIIPNLASPDAVPAWHRLEIAKRRLLYTLFALRLPVESKLANPERGFQFEFLQDSSSPDGPHVYTGHSEGVITINIAEADDPFREKMRLQMGETYRTVLGHFRHEIGHYYWDRLIKDSPRLSEFRRLFGDEREDYAAALQRHYGSGLSADWPERFVSSYASMHPWEDWAESWAHYLHIVDTLETARAFSLSLRPVKAEAPPATDPTLAARPLTLAARRLDMSSFEELITGWTPLTIALNALNRSMGMNDVYPFVLHDPAVEKLRFVHDTIAAHP